MFCANCGKEVQGSGEFCTHCGSRIGGEKRSTSTGLDQSGRLAPGLKTLKGNELVFFSSVALLLISIFLVGEKMFVISYRLFTTQQLEFTLFEGKNFVKILFVLGYLGSAVVLLIPLFTGRDWEKGHFVPGICVQIAVAIMLLVTYIGVAGKMNTEKIMDAVEASMTLTANAWMLMVIVAGNVILLSKACSDVIFTQEYWYKKNLEK